ncbi:MAG: YesL family protein [Eubacteriales bacterium]|nr:YesL family protein [Eubacteriales bacterium]
MGEMLRGFLDNDSTFGRLMTRCGIVIGANIMFILFSFPVVTAGASYVALYHVMLKMLRGDGVINPFKQFWIGFKNNFKQATIYWVVLLALFIFGYMDVTFCRQMGGVWEYFMYAIYALGIVALIITLLLFPTMAAFADTILHLIRNALFFAVKKPFRLLVILFFNIFPLYLTYTDAQMQPLYAFLWVSFGFGAVALLGATLLLPDFKVYLPPVDEYGNIISESETEVHKPKESENHEKTETQRLEEMKKLGM